MEDFQKLAENCVAQEGAEEEDLDILMTRKIPTTKAGACLPACLFESLGIVSAIQSFTANQKEIILSICFFISDAG